MNEKVDFGPRLGADPELFVQDVASSKVVPICGRIGGTKDKPIEIKPEVFGYSKRTLPRWLVDSQGSFAYQEDNVAYEFNIPACTSIDGFARCIEHMVSYAESSLNKLGLCLRFQSSYRFAREDLTDPRASTIGCSPDFDAYRPLNDLQRPPFVADNLGDQRFCGGHLHLQYNKEKCPPFVMAQFMDLVVTLPFLSWDKQGKRREFYGKAGIYRDKPYGIEYRTPSNFWLKPEFRRENLYAMAENCFEIARAVDARSKALQDDYVRIPWGDVQKAINEEDQKAGAELLQFVLGTTSIYINRGAGQRMLRRNAAAPRWEIPPAQIDLGIEEEENNA